MSCNLKDLTCSQITKAIWLICIPISLERYTVAYRIYIYWQFTNYQECIGLLNLIGKQFDNLQHVSIENMINVIKYS